MATPPQIIEDRSYNNEVLQKNRVAVITGAASGIGLASAQAMAKIGMKIVLADSNAAALAKAEKLINSIIPAENVLAVTTDVSKFDEVVNLREKALDKFGEVNLLMNNAAVGKGGGTFEKLENWKSLLDVNLFGVLHGVQAFVPFMQNQENPSIVVNTGSKQGITNPPGNGAYNVSKSAVKTLTEHLAWELRQDQTAKMTAHLLVPGWTFTGLTAAAGGEKPDGAWTADETVAFFLAKLDRGDFYIVVPDNESSSDMDKLRMTWGGTDVANNRPALSRWHPEYKPQFEEYVVEGLKIKELEKKEREGRSLSRQRQADEEKKLKPAE